VVRCSHVVLAASLVAVACDSTKPLPPAVLVSPASLTLEDGQSAKITATLRNPKASRSVTWSSSNTAIAKVDATGSVTAVANGTATIVVKMVDDSTISTTVPVTVSGPAVATMTVTPPVATVFIGTTGIGLIARLRAADGRVLNGRSVTWTTPDASVATVSASGVVRGVAPGGPIALTATSEGRTATALVRVTHAAELCPFITALVLGQRTDGRLALGDCEFSIDESYVDVYEITLTAPGTVQIDMTSTELDAYLGLFDATRTFLAEDDNSGGGRNAQIVKQLNAGRYRVWANTTAGATSGAYALTVTQR
jgi:hypothetical protein